MILARIAEAVPYKEPTNAWERSANWLWCHYPIALYFGIVVPLLGIGYQAVA